ncbi:SAF domain-containing protein [Thalassiella azotivora]
MEHTARQTIPHPYAPAPGAASGAPARATPLGRGDAATSGAVQRRLRRRRALRRARRPLGALLVAAAALLALGGGSTSPTGGTPVTVTTRDLPAGHRLTAADLASATAPRALAPDGVVAVDDAAGRVLTGPVRRGEPVTDARLGGPGRLVGAPPGTVAVPVTFPDPSATALLSPGDRVRVLAGPASSDGFEPGTGDGARVVVRDGAVLEVPDGQAGGGLLASGASGGGVAVLAVTPAEALDLAQVSATRWLGLALLP